MRYLWILTLQFACCLSYAAQTIDDLSFGTESTLEVMTWNIENFPKNGQTTINYVKDIIEALDVDILAIQEVDDISSFNQLVAGLSDYSSYLESTFFAGLAYIYKPDVIQINSIYEIYTTSEYWNYFPRSPMVMDFNFNGQRFIVINNHLKCCGDGILDINDTNDEETRRYYASNLLKDYVDINFSDENVIVLGDLNDILSDAPQNNVFQLMLDHYENYLFADFDIALGSSSEWSYPTWPSHIDHIIITNELFDEFQDSSSDIQTIKIDDYLTNGWSEYDQNISDHRPVALKLMIDNGLNTISLNKQKSKFSNYPNPFKSETLFSFKKVTNSAKIEIYNLQGQIITTLNIRKGQSSILFNSSEFSNGIYIAKLLSNNSIIATKKLVLMK